MFFWSPRRFILVPSQLPINNTCMLDLLSAELVNFFALKGSGGLRRGSSAGLGSSFVMTRNIARQYSMSQ
jgi:hypothetical protein